MRAGLKGIGFALVVFGFSVVDANAQSDLKPLVKKGDQAIDAKDYQSAIEYFQQVVAKLQNLVGETFEAFMPKVLPGWEAGEIDRQSWAGTSEGYSGNMTNLSQKFTRKSDGKICRVNLSNWPQQVTGLKTMVETYKQMGDIMNADPNTKITFEEKHGWAIMRIVDLKRDKTDLHAMANDVMVAINANYANAKEADQYLESMRLSSLGSTAKRKGAPAQN